MNRTILRKVVSNVNAQNIYTVYHGAQINTSKFAGYKFLTNEGMRV